MLKYDGLSCLPFLYHPQFLLPFSLPLVLPPSSPTPLSLSLAPTSLSLLLPPLLTILLLPSSLAPAPFTLSLYPSCTPLLLHPSFTPTLLFLSLYCSLASTPTPSFPLTLSFSSSHNHFLPLLSPPFMLWIWHNKTTPRLLVSYFVGTIQSHVSFSQRTK